MGGLAIDPTCEDRFIPNNAQMALTANGVSFLLAHEPDTLPDISEEEIKDKSKSDSLAKTIACVQAIWFCVQCIARWVERLPVSQLELTTFAHSICTILIFMAWWKKPQNMEKAHILKDDRLKPLVAYMWMASNTSALEKSGTPNITVGKDPEFEAIRLGQKPPSKASASIQDSWVNRYTRWTRNPDPERPQLLVTTTKCLAGTDFYANEDSTRWVIKTVTGDDGTETANIRHETHREPAEFRLSPSDVRRWLLAREAMDRYQLTKPEGDWRFVCRDPVPEIHPDALFVIDVVDKRFHGGWIPPCVSFLCWGRYTGAYTCSPGTTCSRMSGSSNSGAARRFSYLFPALVLLS